MKHLFLALLMCSTSISTLSAQNVQSASTTDSHVKSTDEKFVKKAMEAGLSEVALGRLGQSRSQSESVKEYGRMMEKDHAKANEELRELARQSNINLPSELPSAMENDYRSLKEKSDQNFEKAYMKQMKEDHKKVIELFEEEAKNGQNEQIRTWAEKTLPVLQQHLKHAENIYDNL